MRHSKQEDREPKTESVSSVLHIGHQARLGNSAGHPKTGV